ncbi:MAG TPA: MMPL family transporter [Xanthobacteraceae bacterium]|nr:MMPL family transporter [Xanthobacteraceae bacterium]
MLQSWINRWVGYCIRHFRVVIAAVLVLAAGSAIYTARHFAIDTDTNDLLSAKLPWRQQEIAFHADFPQTVDIILVDVGAPTPEAAEAAARELQRGLANKPNLFHSVRDEMDSPFFRRNGLLFLTPGQVEHVTEQMTNSRPVVGQLVSDPSLRGLIEVLVGSLGYAKQRNMPLDDMARPLNLAAATLESIEQGRPAELSWKVLLQGDPRPLGLHRFVEVWPVLDHSALEPGGRATAAIRTLVSQLDLHSKFGADVTLTGPVIISDNEFSGVQEGIVLNSVVTGGIILIILWLVLRSVRLVTAVTVNLAAGLAITAAGGILMVGALNPISLAFAVLFVGLGADFAIQYTVRYRAERHETDDLNQALRAAAGWVGIPLTLAAGAAAAGFLSFTPTAYSGLAQLGIIAGFGMVVAYASSLTLLPALIRAVNPPPEPKPLTLAALAPVDAFLKRHRAAVIVGTVLVVVAGLPALPRLQFNFNPLALENQRSPALTSLFRLGKEVPLNTARVLIQPDAARSVAARLSALPEVAATWTIESFVPADQDQKLAKIEAAEKSLDPTLHTPPRPGPSDAEVVAALEQGVQALQGAADQQSGVGADAARRLAYALNHLSQRDAGQRARVTDAFIHPLQQDLDDVSQSLTAERVTRATLPSDLVRDWVASDGRVRIEVSPKGDNNDNATIGRFARAVQAVEPDATGEAVGSTEWGSTIVKAFTEAAALALLSIAVLLWIVLRRFTDMLVTLIPLMVAGIVTLEICALAKFQLNYANIIALPVLLGVGVAFKIYYVTAWRHGESHFLESVLTRAVFYSTLLTATAFGSLWLSNQPGISSMGKLLALSLVCTLTSAALFQPALMGEPREPTAGDPVAIGQA